RVQVTGPAQQHVPAVLLTPQRPDGGHGDAGVGGHRLDGAGERGVRAEFDEVAVAVVEQAADGVGEPDGPAQVVEPVGGVEAFAGYALGEDGGVERDVGRGGPDV